MKVIGWDTASKSGALVALEWDPSQKVDSGSHRYRIQSEWRLSVDAAQHSERLLWAIHQMLEACRWKLADIDAIGVGVGPGSFTGLRIGMTTAKTLAYSLGKPLIPVSSLVALSRRAAVHFADHPEKTVIISTTDAAKGELFTLLGSSKSILDCVVKAEGDLPGVWKKGVEEEVLAPEEILKLALKKLETADRWIAVGEGRDRYSEELWDELPKKKQVTLPSDWDHAPSCDGLAALFYVAAQQGVFRTHDQIFPRYLRESDAERKLKSGALKPSPLKRRS